MHSRVGLALCCAFLAAPGAQALAAPGPSTNANTVRAAPSQPGNGNSTTTTQPAQSQKPATPPGSVNNTHNPHSTAGSQPTISGSSGTGGSTTTRTRRRSQRSTSTRSGTRTSGTSAGGSTAGRAGTGTASTGGSAQRPKKRSKKAAKKPPRKAVPRAPAPPGDEGSSVITRTVHDIDKALPGWLKPLLAAAALLILALAAHGVLARRRGRRLERQRAQLLEEIGFLQATLLPEVPGELAGVALSVAYAPAEGPAAGGDFYDAFPLLDGRVAVIVGDISGHGKRALEHTSLLRYTLRAYLGAGFEPRRALETAGRVLESDLHGDFATVIVGIYDPDGGMFAYASAGHPPPIVLGSGAFEPITPCSSPPIGAHLPTGARQTTVQLTGAATLCFYTDGLVEGRRDGEMLGKERLLELLTAPPSGLDADELLRRVVGEIDQVTDDMAVCIIGAPGKPDASPFRLEELEVGAAEHAAARRFLEACELESRQVGETLASIKTIAGEFGAALLTVRFDASGATATVTPPAASAAQRPGELTRSA